MTPEQAAELIEIATSVSQCFYFLTGALCAWLVATGIALLCIGTKPSAN